MRLLPQTFLLLCCLWVPQQVRAQQVSPDQAEQARAAFGHGEEAFAANNFVLALDYFRRAFETRPHPAVRFNIAVCLERLGRFVEAVEQYEQAARSDVLSSQARQDARAKAEAARSHLGTLRTSGPPGAELWVDGEARCSLPCEVTLDPGEHRLTLNGRSQRALQTVQVEPGSTRDVRFAPSEVDVPQAIGDAPVAAHEPPVVEPASHPDARRGRAGVLFWTGSALAVAAGAGALGFGLATRSAHEQYERSPTQAGRDDGLRLRGLTNGAFAVLGVGAVLAIVDLLRRHPKKAPADRATWPGQGLVRHRF